MAKGIGEPLNRSPASILQMVDYPATRVEIVEAAGDSEAPVEVINFLKCLPQENYSSVESALRDFAEAERRFGMSNQSDGPDRRNIGRTAAEDAPASTPSRHP